MNAGNEEQPKELLSDLPSTHEGHHALVVPDRGSRHNRSVRPSVPQQNLPTPTLERTKVKRQRVVDPPRSPERCGFAVEIELKGLYARPLLFIDKIALEWAGQICIRKAWRCSRSSLAVIVPTLPLRFRSGDIGIRIHVLAL